MSLLLLPDNAPVPRLARPFPVERLLRDTLDEAIHSYDVPLILEHLGVLDRYDEGCCQRIWKEVRSRSTKHPTYNEQFVAEQLARVGTDRPVGLRARERWIAGRLSRFTDAVDAAYRRRTLVTLSPTHRAFLRALYVSCVMRANVLPAESIAATTTPSRQSGP